MMMFKIKIPPIYKKTLIIFSIYLLGALIYLSFNNDEAINPEVKKLIKIASIEKANDGHANLFALNAPANIDATEFGHKNIENYLLNKSSDTFNFETILDTSGEHYSNCTNNIQLCFEEFKSKKRTFIEFNETDYALKKRIDIIESTIPADNIIEPTLHSPYPPYKLLTSYQNRNFQRLIHLFLQGDKEHVINYLIKDIHNKRKTLKSSKLLIHYLVFIQLITNNIDLLELLLDPKISTPVINEFTFSEISLHQVISTEIRFNHNVLLEINNWNFSDEEINYSENIVMKSIMSALIKPNKTLNQYAQQIQNIYWKPNESLDEFLNRDFTNLKSNNFSLNNIIGDIINKNSMVSYIKHQFQSLQLACKINQINKIIDKQNSTIPIITEQQCNKIDNLLQKALLFEENQ